MWERSLFSPESERLYTRFVIDDSRIGSVRIAGKVTGTIKDISYGGVSIVTDALCGLAVNDEPYELELTLGGKTFETSALLTYFDDTSEIMLGFCFSYEQVGLIAFLRDFLEKMKVGYVLRLNQSGDVLADEELLEDIAVADQPPVEIDLDDDYVRVKYRQNTIFVELKYENGLIETFHDVGAGAILTAHRQTKVTDPYVLRSCLAVLAGYVNGDWRAVEGMLDLFFYGDQSLPASA